MDPGLRRDDRNALDPGHFTKTQNSGMTKITPQVDGVLFLSFKKFPPHSADFMREGCFVFAPRAGEGDLENMVDGMVFNEEDAVGEGNSFFDKVEIMTIVVLVSFQILMTS